MSRLAAREVWTNPDLWEGYARCANLLRPESFALILRLPDDRVRDMVAKFPDLKALLRNEARNDPGLLAEPRGSESRAAAGGAAAGQGQAGAEQEEEEEDAAAAGAGGPRAHVLSRGIREFLELV
jgi:symplekin